MTHRILNSRPQPVELHLANGVVVIPPLGEVEVEAGGAAERQLEYLAADLRITVLPAAEPAKAETPAEVEEFDDAQESGAEVSVQETAKERN